MKNSQEEISLLLKNLKIIAIRGLSEDVLDSFYYELEKRYNFKIVENENIIKSEKIASDKMSKEKHMVNDDVIEITKEKYADLLDKIIEEILNLEVLDTKKLLVIIEKYTSLIPFDLKNPDISFYDHVKTSLSIYSSL